MTLANFDLEIETTDLSDLELPEPVVFSLNPEQERAVNTISGPVLIIAGPGSGKTRVITERIKNIVNNGIPASQIMAVTFTNKAANEMRNRLVTSLGQDTSDFTIGTFHRICGLLLRKHGSPVGVSKDFNIFDQSDCKNIVYEIMREKEMRWDMALRNDILDGISRAKSCLVTPENYMEALNTYMAQGDIYWSSDFKVSRHINSFYPRYQQKLAQENALDFDDMIMLCVKLLEEHPEVKSIIQNEYTHYLVDEFQDTNEAQSRLVNLLSDKDSNICVVGDPDQSIYGWRNANIGNIMQFEHTFPQTERFHLGRNYRSTKTIVNAANNLISHNHVRFCNPVYTERDQGQEIKIISVHDDDFYSINEAQKIIDLLSSRIGENDSWSDCMIAYRTNKQSRALEEHCVQFGVPYHLVGGTPFYERKEVKDLLAYMRVINNPDDNTSLKRIINYPSRFIGGATVDKLMAYADENECNLLTAVYNAKSVKDLTPSALKAVNGFARIMKDFTNNSKNQTVFVLAANILKRTDFLDSLKRSEFGRERKENVAELVKSMESFGNCADPEKGLSAYLNHVATYSEIDTADDNDNGLTLITLHRSKGLEFKYVAIVGCRQGILPMSLNDDKEEERRLFYVGVTRAKDELYLGCPANVNKISQYVLEMRREFNRETEF